MPAGREAVLRGNAPGLVQDFFAGFLREKIPLIASMIFVRLRFFGASGGGEVLAVFFPVVVDPVFNRLLTVRPFSRLLFFPVRARSSCLRQ